MLLTADIGWKRRVSPVERQNHSFLVRIETLSNLLRGAVREETTIMWPDKANDIYLSSRQNHTDLKTFA